MTTMYNLIKGCKLSSTFTLTVLTNEIMKVIHCNIINMMIFKWIFIKGSQKLQVLAVQLYEQHTRFYWSICSSDWVAHGKETSICLDFLNYSSEMASSCLVVANLSFWHNLVEVFLPYVDFKSISDI